MKSIPLLLMAGALYAFLPPEVTLNVWPGFAQMPPATFVFVVITPRHPDNRGACFITDGPERKSFCWDLAGEQASRVQRFEWPYRVPGEYEAVAVLTRMENGKDRIYSSRQPFRVIGSDLP